ncbi:helix-turn-helix domain-containing protein [Gorillibacterium sp. sgz500922]|uniref:helix-turn-helix domain-containing protein n=1 Tax=Gorillibacterium sp. sgz500922 TaxID=3446694 RepID=UPI003F678E91
MEVVDLLRLKLEELLYEKRISKLQISKITGIRYPTILDMADNKSKAWSPENLEKLMNALELESVADLIEYKKEQEG